MNSSSLSLDTFWNGSHVGVFFKDGAHIAFRYDEDAPSFPISLSLPRDGSFSKSSPERFLANLLPDNPRVRSRWSRELKIENTPFMLLSRMGEDVAGALSLVPEGQNQRASTGRTQFASEDEIAGRIAAIKEDSDAWLSAEQLGRSRMSLAGAQGKFSLAKISDRWAWSTLETPSTHIIKPPMSSLRETVQMELGGQLLANRVGLEAATSELIEFRGEQAYVVTRFDRHTKSEIVSRVHMEDIAQALGIPPQQKYQVSAITISRFLKERLGDEVAYQFLAQMAYNVTIGNADAHSKNYSIMLEGTPRMSPLYDSIPTLVWTELTDKRLAMPVGGAKYAQAADANNWRKLATSSGLDEERVVDTARHIAAEASNRAFDVFLEVGTSKSMASRAAKVIQASSKHMLS